MIGNLYFIREWLDGAIKIGWTTHALERRRAGLQTGNSKKLYVLGSIPGVEKSVEAEWHKRFRHIRIRAEWFHPTIELREAIEGFAPTEQPAPPQRARKRKVEAVAHMHPLTRWMDRNFVSQTDFAPKIGVASCHLSQMLSGKRGVTVATARRIEIATGGQVTAIELLNIGQTAGAGAAA